ncbi:MAG: bifunctional [glutamate--ammonia ligase]-adenylyl-L-tyrosine phosphorylase/[glutamate--ammonia-ligase] adenylyltransferase, partial [Gemmatimonadetes bacterium]|nr:bifunctional [glutamate--ammonia ligase]-adenylyl-L-tyrosine phosphorylase/[glutamate--ammonia-ligase] adenylyltransferase [Gemmatimonadota bacterium]
LRQFGFRDPAAADEHLQAVAEDLPVREAMGALAGPLLEALARVPDPDAGVVGFSRYVATRFPRVMFVRYLVEDPRALGVLVEVLGTSPFLSEILIRNPEYLHWLVSQIDRSPPEAIDLVEEVETLVDRVEAADAHADALKRFRRRELLRIASRDSLGIETLESTIGQISDLADVVTGQTLRLAERRVLAAAGLERLPGRFAVLGMGKLGGRELNYSSDIDLLFVYEPDEEQDQTQHVLFHTLGRALFALMTEFSDEGYLYRVDLRLRPMGRRGNIAYSLRQHLQYYDDWGETFERFALIKARSIAGDADLGDRFIRLVQPFVYRKYLDHAALEEIFRYKERAEKSRDNADRDVKVGRGGIREIELFTQALQLTYGAVQPALREANTLGALRALVEAGLISEEIRGDLARAYAFLRTVEHRLQIVHEQQTHELARAERELETCARRLGLPDADALEGEIDRTRDRVRAIYNMLFERRAGTFDFEGRQIFRILTGEADDEEARAFLAAYALSDPGGALDVIRSLDRATSHAPSRSMARNVLANLLAALLDRLPRCARPDRVLARFEQVAERTGAPASLYRTLLENDALRNLLVSTLDFGDLPVARLIRYPELFDSLLFTLPGLDELARRYRAALAGVEPDRRLGQIRRLKAIEEFKILVESVSDGSLTRLEERLSLLADTCVAQAAAWSLPPRLDAVEWAIVALGKLGGSELTVHSDLDLVVLYRGDSDDSDTFLALQRFVQDMERCLEEPTEEGVAYHIDTRLRPEGRKGALAMPVGMFHTYLASRAEIWERLAWTRSRVLAGADALAREVEASVRQFVYGPWDPAVPRYMTDLRGRMERELGDPSGRQLEFKIGRGGLADIDFLLQMIQIREGHARPAFQVPGTRRLLEQLPETAFLTGAEVDELRRAHGFLRSLETFARMEMNTNVSAVADDPARLEVLGRRLGLEDPAADALVETFRHQTDRVRTIYENVIRRL